MGKISQLIKDHCLEDFEILHVIEQTAPMKSLVGALVRYQDQLFILGLSNIQMSQTHIDLVKSTLKGQDELFMTSISYSKQTVVSDITGQPALVDVLRQDELSAKIKDIISKNPSIESQDHSHSFHIGLVPRSSEQGRNYQGGSGHTYWCRITASIKDQQPHYQIDSFDQSTENPEKRKALTQLCGVIQTAITEFHHPVKVTVANNIQFGALNQVDNLASCTEIGIADYLACKLGQQPYSLEFMSEEQLDLDDLISMRALASGQDPKKLHADSLTVMGEVEVAELNTYFIQKMNGRPIRKGQGSQCELDPPAISEIISTLMLIPYTEEATPQGLQRFLSALPISTEDVSFVIHDFPKTTPTITEPITVVAAVESNPVPQSFWQRFVIALKKFVNWITGSQIFNIDDHQPSFSPERSPNSFSARASNSYQFTWKPNSTGPQLHNNPANAPRPY